MLSLCLFRCALYGSPLVRCRFCCAAILPSCSLSGRLLSDARAHKTQHRNTAHHRTRIRTRLLSPRALLPCCLEVAHAAPRTSQQQRRLAEPHGEQQAPTGHAQRTTRQRPLSLLLSFCGTILCVPSPSALSVWESAALFRRFSPSASPLRPQRTATDAARHAHTAKHTEAQHAQRMREREHADLTGVGWVWGPSATPCLRRSQPNAQCRSVMWRGHTTNSTHRCG